MRCRFAISGRLIVVQLDTAYIYVSGTRSVYTQFVIKGKKTTFNNGQHIGRLIPLISGLLSTNISAPMSSRVRLGRQTRQLIVIEKFENELALIVKLRDF